MPHDFLAIDLGAESGRAILATLDGEHLSLTDVHRFGNGPVRLPDGLHWDILRLWSEIKTALHLVTHKHNVQLAGIGIDTWGVDYGLLDRTGALIGNPYHYRDSRTDGLVEESFKRLPRERIFDLTGIQFMQLNTLYQLFSQAVQQSPSLQIAETFLTTPDLLNYWLSGRTACEFTMATTTQCYNPRECAWSKPLLDALGIPSHIFPEVVQPGTVLGVVLPEIAEELGCGRVPVIAPACHDTGSAVAAVPAENKNFAWISSGTWSIMGAEASDPIVNAQSLKYNFTNEGGVNGTWRFSKNIMGLWLVQECRRAWARAGEELSYDDLTQLAAEAEPFKSIIDVDCNDFFQPGDMPARIQKYCARTQQPRASDQRRDRALRVGKPRVEVSLGVGTPGRDAGLSAGTDPHHRRRDQEPPARSTHGGRYAPIGDHRPDRSDGDRQCVDAGRRAGPSPIVGGSPRRRAAFLQAGNV